MQPLDASSPITIEISHFEPRDKDDVINLVLPIQTEEFGVQVTLESQPDLSDVGTFFQHGKGNFWVAKVDGLIVGSVGLLDIGNSQAALRKMFVAKAFRGKEFGVARKLLETLIFEASRNGIDEIFLGTTEKYHAAHRFYERNGFERKEIPDLPVTFPRMSVDTRFYLLRIRPS